MMPFRKIPEHRRAVVTDCRQPQACLPDPFQALLQLDELAFAVGSPIRGTEKHQHCAFRTGDVAQRLYLSVLVG